MQNFVITRHAMGKHHESPISDIQYHEAKRAFNQLHQLVLLEERFDAIAGGFLDFEKAMLAEMVEFAYAGFKDGLHQMSVRRKLNRLLMNALSAARGYIDHLPQACNEIFGKQDARTVSCLSGFSNSYDDLVGYRMFEALRNHAQHCGFPIHSVSYAHQREGEPPHSRFRLTIAPMADTNELAQNNKFKKSVLLEMKGLGERIDLKPYLREYMRGIAKTHYGFREFAKPIADSAHHTLDALASRYLEESDSSDLLAVRAVLSERGQVVDSVPLSTGLKEYFDYLSTNNERFDKEGDFYVASVGRC